MTDRPSADPDQRASAAAGTEGSAGAAPAKGAAPPDSKTPGESTAESRRLAKRAAGLLALAALARRGLDWPSIHNALLARLDWPALQSATKAIWLADVWCDGLGVLAILLLVATLDRRRPPGLWAAVAMIARPAAMALAPGALADGVNLFAGWLGLLPAARPVPWVVALAGSLTLQAAQLGPAVVSPHAAAATGLALALARRYRHGRWLFAAYALLAIAERLLFFPDTPWGVFAGAALGSAWCAACVHPRLLGRFFDSLEARSAAGSKTTP